MGTPDYYNQDTVHLDGLVLGSSGEPRLRGSGYRVVGGRPLADCSGHQLLRGRRCYGDIHVWVTRVI
jgi:hypothetical protein